MFRVRYVRDRQSPGFAKFRSVEDAATFAASTIRNSIGPVIVRIMRNGAIVWEYER